MTILGKVKSYLKSNSQYVIYLAVALFSIGFAFYIFESSTFHFNFKQFHLLNYPISSVFWSGLLIAALLYIFAIGVFGNIFLTSLVYIAMFVGVGLANMEKLKSTGNPVFWTDIVMGMHPIEMFSLVDMNQYIWLILLGSVILVALGYFQFFIWNKKYCLRIRQAVSIKKIICTRLLMVVISGSLLLTFLYFPKSMVSTVLLRKDNENYKEWNMGYNYRTNGSLYSLIRNIRKVASHEPQGYSKEAIQQITNDYRRVAQRMNQTRQNTGKDRKVIFLLSETFSDPERVVGFKLAGDPIPNIRQLMKDHLSGTIIVPGMGGGTSDTEWTILTSLNMSMLAGDINSPYTDFYYEQNNPQTILNLLDKHLNQTVAVHGTPPIYYRNGDVYQNIGVREYYSTQNVKNFEPVSKEKPFVSDKSFFNVLLEKINQPNNKVVIGQSMQNHQPFNYEYFKDNRFYATGSGTETELKQLRNYAQGLSITDQEIQPFLEKVEASKDEMTVVFFGDHIPVAYVPYANVNSYPTMHSGDYFIYNNHGYSNQKRLAGETGQTHSSSFLANKLLWNLDMKVSPFYAMTTQIEQQLPIISKEYIGSVEKPVTENQLSVEQKKLLNDYQMITYDILTGKQYSLRQQFFEVQ